MVIDYQNLYKLRIANPDDSMVKHEVIKLIILLKLLKKYKNQRSYIHIYTEFNIVNNDKTKKTDLLLLDIRKKEAYSYEIQKKIDNEWTKEVNDFYKDWNYPMMRTSDLIIIPIKDLDDDINILSKQLDQYIF